MTAASKALYSDTFFITLGKLFQALSALRRKLNVYTFVPPILLYPEQLGKKVNQTGAMTKNMRIGNPNDVLAAVVDNAIHRLNNWGLVDVAVVDLNLFTPTI